MGCGHVPMYLVPVIQQARGRKKIGQVGQKRPRHRPSFLPFPAEHLFCAFGLDICALVFRACHLCVPSEREGAAPPPPPAPSVHRNEGKNPPLSQQWGASGGLIRVAIPSGSPTLESLLNRVLCKPQHRENIRVTRCQLVASDDIDKAKATSTRREILVPMLNLVPCPQSLL